MKHLFSVVVLIFIMVMNGEPGFAKGKKTFTPKESSKSFTVVNNSNTTVFYQFYASDKRKSVAKYTTIMATVNPASKVEYKSATDIPWSGKAPKAAFRFTFFRGMFMDASGGCVADAADYIGNKKDKYAQATTLNTAKCGGTTVLNLKWSSEKGKVTVTIN